MAKKLSQLNLETERSVDVTLTVEGQPYPVTVYFAGRSANKTNALMRRIGDSGFMAYQDYLAVYVTRIVDGDGLPAFINEDGTPAELTAEVYGTWSADNLRALHDAIEGAINPDPQSPSEA